MFYDTYLMLCTKLGEKPSAMATELKINKSIVSNWKSSGYTPRGEAVQKIADTLHVSTDYLLGVDQLDDAFLNEKIDNICNELKEIIFHINIKE